MDLEFIIFLAILITLFGLLISIVIFLPRQIIRLRANIYGLKINSKQALIIQKCKCANKTFFKNAKSIWDMEKIPIDRLAIHVVSSGNLTNIKNGIEKLKKYNLNIDFSVLSAIDLTNKDISEAVNQSMEIKTINVERIRNKNMTIDYQVKYVEIFPDNVWSKKTIESNQELIRKRLEKFIANWNEADPIHTENFIRQNILSIDYLEKEIGSIKKQEYKISTGGNIGS